MLRALLGLLGLRDGEESAGSEDGGNSAGGDDSEDGGDDEGGFMPSRLDASVLESHVMGTTAAEQELASIEEQAETLDAERPDEHPPDHKP